MNSPMFAETRPPVEAGVLCAGAVVLDTIVRPFDQLNWGTTAFVDSIESRVGGSAANTAIALGILNIRVRVAASLGQDQAAEIVRRELNRSHVDVSAIDSVDKPTPQTIVLVNDSGERQFLHRKGCSELAFSQGLRFTPELVANMSHFHLASLFVVPHLRELAPRILQQARAVGLTTSLDTCWDPGGEWLKVLRPCLPELGILFMNEDEAAQIAEGRSILDLASWICDSGTGTVVIKRSRDGCRVYQRGQEIACPAYDVVARDSTGAGDCFVAGYLAAHLQGGNCYEAGLNGNAAGALSIQSIGAVDGLLPEAKFLEWKRRTPLRRTKV